MSKLIFLPTIQASGTWFCINLLRAHPAITYFSVLSDVDESKLDRNTSLVQVHFGMTNFAPEESWDAEYKKKFAPIDIVEKWMKRADKVVVPVRDPLAALLSAYKRPHPLRPIVDGFVTLAGWPKENIFIFPIDLYLQKTPVERYGALCSLFDYLELSREGFLSDLADKWNFVNTMGRYELKRFYDQGLFANIRGHAPEVEYLMSKRDVLRPFLDAVGYGKLMWY